MKKEIYFVVFCTNHDYPIDSPCFIRVKQVIAHKNYEAINLLKPIDTVLIAETQTSSRKALNKTVINDNIVCGNKYCANLKEISR